MENKSNSMLIAAVVLVLLVAGAAFFMFSGKGQSFKIGDQVFAEWTPKVWYSGKIDAKCDKGFHVAYKDGDQKCVSTQELIADNVPTADEVKVGTNIIAQWANGPYYNASVTAISGNQYSILYSDKTSGTKTLAEMRVDGRKVTQSTATPATTTTPSAAVIPTTPVTPVTPSVTTPAATTSKFKQGDSVVALWSGSSWYLGKVGASCEGGFMIAWNDGSTPSCVKEASITPIRPPTKEVAKVGTAVYGKWSGNAYCDAKITKVDGAKYSITCSDNYKKDGLGLIDLLMK